MSKHWQHLVKGFGKDEQGVVALLFGLMTMVLFTLSALAVDYSRVLNMRSRITTSVDAASLAAGRAMLDGKLSDGDIITMATAYFTENVKPAAPFGTVGTPTIKINRVSGTVDIDVQSSVKMTLANIAGFDKLDIPVVSTAVYQQKDIEVGMALDVTGSMNDFAGGQRKIDALKTAFGKFADRIIPDQENAAQKVRIGLAPYSASINLGSYAAVASANKSTDGCVSERKSGAFGDGTDPFLVKADGINDVDPTEGLGSKFTCPQAALMPLSDDKAALKASVNAYSLSAATGGHFGVQWAWNLVSDKWASNWGSAGAPDSYDRIQDGKLLKAVVLMTDGIFNTAFHGQTSAQQAISLCNAMKSKGVVVFAVAFGAPAAAQQTLKSCATAGSQYYANAADPAQLEAAFDSFAAQLTALRISK